MQTTTIEYNTGAQTQKLLHEFDKAAKLIRKVLVARYGAENAIAIAEATRHEYAALIPQLPDIGGKRNPLSWNLIGAAWFLALYKVLKRRGTSLAEISNVIYTIYAAWYDRYPPFLLRLLGCWKFTPLAFRQVQRRAWLSQQRRYPGDWVFTAFKGDGATFDWGVDYTECGIVKLFREQGAAEFTPYLCHLDFLTSQRWGLGLARTMTLAEGADKCDFRFKRGAATFLPAPYFTGQGLGPTDQKLKILVYGAGVLGSLYAARLQAAGHQVALLARGQRLADLREHGLVWEDALTDAQTVTHVDLVEQLAPDDVYDLVIVLMRKNQVAAILPTLAANKATPTVLFMVNNAAGPDEYIQALGRERVLLGFPGAGGERDGYIIRGIAEARGIKGRVTLGEVDGALTPRLQTIADAFQLAGFPVAISPDMNAWLKTHVALVSPIANALYMAGGDNYRLARTRDTVVLTLRAIREGLAVLQASGIPLLPLWVKLLAWLPEPILVPLLQRLFNTKLAEIALARHANAARDEMQQLADEFRRLARATAVPTPATDRLYT